MDIKALESERKIHTTGLLIPAVNFNANGGYFGRINGQVSPMDPVANPSTNQLYPTGLYQFSLGWNLPLGSLIYKGDRKKIDAKLLSKNLEIEVFKEEAKEEIRNAKSDMAIGIQQLKFSKESVRLSSKALSQSGQRQKLGIAQAFEMFQAQEFFVNAQLAYLQTVCDYNKAYFSLQVAEGLLLGIQK